MQDDVSQEQKTDEAPRKGVALQKIYIKDISFEAPGTPEIFSSDWAPEVSQEIRNAHRQIDEDIYESVLTITITVKIANKVAYLIEVSQAGIFGLPGHSQKALETTFGIFCPTILFPYAREAISDLSTRGGFPQFLMQNINFHAMFDEYLRQKEMAQQGNAGTDVGITH